MRLVVFDMDGTLIDTHAMIAEHMGAAFADAGLAAPTNDAVRTIIGLNLAEAASRLAASTDAALIGALVESYKQRYRASLIAADDREPLFPRAREVLDRLRARPEIVLGIATGKGLAGAARILDFHGLTGHFVTVQTPDHNPGKPHPGMLFSAMAETGADKHQTVMIGDTVFDIETAEAAGVASIGVSWGYHPSADLTEAGAKLLVDDYSELEAAIEQVLGRSYA